LEAVGDAKIIIDIENIIINDRIKVALFFHINPLSNIMFLSQQLLFLL
jgi:hypothetical protein